MSTLVPVILAGGSGTRLWPVSREAYPKQLVRLTGNESLLQETARRLMARAPAERIVVIGAAAHDHLVKHQLEGVHPEASRHRLLEPVGRNTAAAIGLGALYAADRFGASALLWVCPSDHLIDHPETLFQALEVAIPVAEEGALLTFGITPNRAETGYGYIQAGGPLTPLSSVLKAVRFVEKPERRIAEAMIAQGGHFWNSGIFLFRADRILEELEAHEPEIRHGVGAAFAALARSGDTVTVPEEIYREIPAAPIDKAVMERSPRIAVVPCDPGWSDLGSWQALWERLPKDGRGNATRGDTWLDGADSCLVRADARLVACAGIHDLAVIETDDAVLIADRRNSDAVRAVVGALKREGRQEALAPREEHHAWGSLRILEKAPGVEVQSLALAPGNEVEVERTGHDRYLAIAEGALAVHSGLGVATLTCGQSLAVPKHRPLRLANVTADVARATLVLTLK